MYLTALGRRDEPMILDELLNRILRLVFDWVDADRGCIMLRDPETEQLASRQRAATGRRRSIPQLWFRPDR